MERKLQDFFNRYERVAGSKLTGEQKNDLINALELEYQAWFLSTIIEEIEEIMSIPPHLRVRDILQTAAKRIVHYLEADAATIRIFDADTLNMTSFGAFGVADSERISSIPVRDSIAGKVAREKKAIAVSDIMSHPLYKDKSVVKGRGFHSLLAVPLISPMADVGDDKEILGSIQIYYKEKDKKFNNLEIIHAELLARRISFVLAKKKILALQELNNRKEVIVTKIFEKVSRREIIKLKDLFILLIPELKEFLELKGCSLFTVSDNRQFIHLEASYPQDNSYHDPNYSFTIDHHPYFRIAVEGPEETGENDSERITSSYILIRKPRESCLVTNRLLDYVFQQHIHSILLVPLKVSNQTRHLLTFYASDRKMRFSEDEIELLTFFGKEIMKASKLEFLADVLHDIKNPAVAIAGFANRAIKLFSENGEMNRQKLASYLEIIASEAARLQDLTMAMSGSGREEVLDLAELIRRRFQILKQFVKESKLENVRINLPDLEENLIINCPRYSLERVLDNLFNNAAKAIPEKGGEISVTCFGRDNLAWLIVENSGEIPADQIEQVRLGKVKGRGLNIISRFVHAHHGNIKIETEDGKTRFTITLPLARTSD